MSVLVRITEELIGPKVADRVRDALVEAALLLRRAGLEHLMTEASQDEIEAMAEAGTRLAHERAVLFAEVFMDPAKAKAMFDGGASLRHSVLKAALAASRES